MRFIQSGMGRPPATDEELKTRTWFLYFLMRRKCYFVHLVASLVSNEDNGVLYLGFFIIFKILSF